MPSKRNSTGTPGRQGPVPDATRLSSDPVAEPEDSGLETPERERKHQAEQNGTFVAKERTESCHVPVASEHFSEGVGNVHDNEATLWEIRSKLKAGDANTALRMIEILDHHIQASPDPKNRVFIPHIQNLLATAQSQPHELKKPENVHKAPSPSQFWVLFFSVYGLTILCALMSCYLSVHYANDTIRSLNEKLQSVFTLGCGSIIGMLGARRFTN